MSGHWAISKLLMILAIGPLASFSATAAPKPAPTKASKTAKSLTTQRPAKIVKAVPVTPGAPPKRFEQKYEEALGEHSAKRAKIREARQAEQDAQLGPSQAELILQGKPVFAWSKWVGEYAPKIDLVALFPADFTAPRSAPEYLALEKEWAQVRPRFEILRERTTEQLGSARGDLENPELRLKIAQIYKISLLRLRLSGADQTGAWALTEGDIWMRALTAMAFDESTSETMRWVSEQRSLYAGEMLAKMKSLPIATFRMDPLHQHLRQLKLPWPVDRIYLTESRKVLKPGAQLVANGLSGDLQKFPFKDLESLRRARRGVDASGLAALDLVYTLADVQLRQKEDDLFNEYRLRVARALFEKRQGALVKDLEQLKAAGLIDRVPIHHVSGQFWSITQL